MNKKKSLSLVCKTLHFRITQIAVILLFALFSTVFAEVGYRIEVSNPAVANTSIFLAGYYGDRIFVVDSAMTDASGSAVFERQHLLCAGMYTLVAPGNLQYDLLIDTSQRFRVLWSAAGDVSVEGDEHIAAWVAYQETELADRAQLREQIIGQYSGSLLADYLKALQPMESPSIDKINDMAQLMSAYRSRRRNFFANMPLSDARLLRTPIYHENIHYYMTQFVTQHPDSLIHIAYSMLEQASGNYETFFYVSDYMLDYYSQHRNVVRYMNRFYNFIIRNRDMLGTTGMAMLPARSRANYFAIPDEGSLQNWKLTGIDGQSFDTQTIGGDFHIYYFWKNKCPRCIADISRWQSILNRFQNRSVSGIAVNIENKVQQPENMILEYEPLCINVSASNMPICRTIFFATYYSKILVTDAAGNIVGLFASPVLLENFLNNVF